MDLDFMPDHVIRTVTATKRETRPCPQRGREKLHTTPQESMEAQRKETEVLWPREGQMLSQQKGHLSWS